MRLIDADATIEKYGDWYVEEGTEEGFIGTLNGLLTAQPTVEPKRGRWIEDDYIIICSECRKPAMQRVLYSLTYHTTDIKMVKTPYCPHCGAAMAMKEGKDASDD